MHCIWTPNPSLIELSWESWELPPDGSSCSISRDREPLNPTTSSKILNLELNKSLNKFELRRIWSSLCIWACYSLELTEDAPWRSCWAGEQLSTLWYYQIWNWQFDWQSSLWIWAHWNCNTVALSELSSSSCRSNDDSDRLCCSQWPSCGTASSDTLDSPNTICPPAVAGTRADAHYAEAHSINFQKADFPTTPERVLTLHLDSFSYGCTIQIPQVVDVALLITPSTAEFRTEYQWQYSLTSFTRKLSPTKMDRFLKHFKRPLTSPPPPPS